MDELQGAACAIGGMARTQWSRTKARYVSEESKLQSTQPIQTIREIFPIPPWPTKTSEQGADELLSSLTDWCEQAAAADCAEEPFLCLERVWPQDYFPVDERQLRDLDDILGKVAEKINKLPGNEVIELRGFCYLSLAPAMETYVLPPDHVIYPSEWPKGRLDLAFSRIIGLLLVKCYGVKRKCLRLGGYGLGHRDDWSRTGWDRNYVTFGVFEEDWIPGRARLPLLPGILSQSLRHDAAHTDRRGP